MKMPKKPRLKKQPKRPKGKMTLEKSARYKERVAAVCKENAGKIAEYKKEKNQYEAHKKKIQSNLNQIEKLKASHRI